MPPRKDMYQHDELGRALRYLRERRLGVTRDQLVERVKAAGGQISKIYLAKLEGGERKQIAGATLDQVLAALSSSRVELDGLLAHAPWAEAERSTYRVTRGTPTPESYRRAAAEAMQAVDGSWSSPVGGAPETNMRLRGEISELCDLYVAMTPHERAQLLDQARRMSS